MFTIIELIVKRKKKSPAPGGWRVKNVWLQLVGMFGLIIFAGQACLLNVDLPAEIELNGTPLFVVTPTPEQLPPDPTAEPTEAPITPVPEPTEQITPEPSPEIFIPDTGPTPPAVGEVLSGDVQVPFIEDGPSFTDLERYMLPLINADRQAHDLKPLEWDDLAAEAGRQHAIEMVRHQYMSHLNLAGEGPGVRFNLLGGREAVLENLFSMYHRFENGGAVPITDWEGLIREAQHALMESPGHRDNILEPNITHVGVGIAYDSNTGEFRLAQIFIFHYITYEQPAELPMEVEPGEAITVQGNLLVDATAVVLNLAYQPFPEPLRLDELVENNMAINQTDIIYASRPLSVAGGALQNQVRIPVDGQTGYYHLRVWLLRDDTEIPAADILLIYTEKESLFNHQEIQN